MKISELKGMMRRVYDICERHFDCRSDDSQLIFLVWKEDIYNADETAMSIILSEPIKLDVQLMRKLSKPETIRRARQKLQQAGLILPTHQVESNRADSAEEIRTNIKNL